MSPIERAFELARSGDYANPGEVKRQLYKEGVDTFQLTGAGLARQLLNLCREAQGKPTLGPKVLKRHKERSPEALSEYARRSAATRMARRAAAEAGTSSFDAYLAGDHPASPRSPDQPSASPCPQREPSERTAEEPGGSAIGHADEGAVMALTGGAAVHLRPL